MKKIVQKVHLRDKNIRYVCGVQLHEREKK